MGVIPKSLVLWVSLAMEVCIVIIYADMNKQCFSGEWNLLIETNKFVYLLFCFIKRHLSWKISAC